MKNKLLSRFKRIKAAQPPSTATPSPNATEAPDRDTPILLSQEDLMKRACSFESYSSSTFAPGVTVREGLENLDDLIAYGVSETHQKELWKDEIARISAAVTDMDTPISFQGSDEFSVDSKEAHERLARLADKMLVAFNIAFHDSQGILVKNVPHIAEKADILDNTRGALERYVSDAVDDDSDSDATKFQNAHPVASDISHADYFEFVNYVTAIIARMMCNAASGKTWHDTIIVKFAKMAAKMKVVSGRLREHAATSLQNTPKTKLAPDVDFGGADGRNANLGSQERNTLGDLHGMLGVLNQKESQPAFAGPNTSYIALTRLYYMYESMIQMPVFKLYRHVLIGLRGTNILRTALSTSYEISAMLYKTGYGNFPVFLFQDIDGEYLGSSSDENINISHASFQVVNLAVKGLILRYSLDPTASKGGSSTSNTRPNGNHPESANPRVSDMDITPPPPPNHPKSVGTTISCYYSEDPKSSTPDQKRKYRLNTMSNVITVIVPMVLTSPYFVTNVNYFIGLFTFVYGHLIDGEPPILYRPTEFEASFCLTTDEYRKMWRDRQGKGFVSQLSDSLVARDTLLSWPPDNRSIRRIPTANMALPVANSSQEDEEDQEEQRQIQHNLKQFDLAKKRMKDWVFEENGVRVRCDWYVGTVSTAAALLVIAGIAAAVTMGERLPGVDPFNITTFSWILATFIILIAKSARVVSWPWWDFLHRQVLCRSLSELKAVTGIDEQLLLARLLQEESGTRLQTRGPYNTVFLRKASGGDGFSIDQPVSIRTMLLSGLIMIQVQAIYHGKFLVCLDLRRGTDYHLISQTREAKVEEGECIISDGLTGEPVQGTIHRINLKTAKASWSRVIGVFGRKNAVFY
ncbi:hypothetical protein ACHAPI_001196 [Fusarium lateritium]